MDIKIKIHWSRVLPLLLTLLTGVERYRVDNIEWSPDSLTYNFFRLLDIIFWRPFGEGGVGDTLRPTSVTIGAEIDGKLVVTYKFYAVEALLMHAEGAMRSFFKKPKFAFKIVPIPQFAGLPGMFAQKPIFNFAIAFDLETGDGTQSNVSVTYTNIAVAGPNPLIVVFETGVQTTHVCSGITYNAVSFTQTGSSPQVGASANTLSSWTLVGQSGTHNVVTSASAGTIESSIIISYSGAKQSGQPDATISGAVSGVATHTLTLVTSSTANCWALSGIRVAAGTVYSLGGSLSAGRGSLSQAQTASAAADSNATVAASSSISLTWNWTSGTTDCAIGLSIAPVLSTDLTVSVSDSVTLAESVSRTLISLISKSESITITEAVTMQLLSFISKTESITITESITMQMVSLISKSESITITEAVTMQMTSFISKSESITIGEAITMLMTSFISKSDSITLAESISRTLVSSISTSDSLTLAESLTVQNSQLGGISVSDSVTLSESITVQNTQLGDISVTDSLTLTDSISVLSILNLSTTDSITVADTVLVQVPNLGGISVHDSLTITDSVTLFVPDQFSGIAIMRGNEAAYPFGMDQNTTSGPSDMRGNENNWPLGMDDKTIL